MKVILTKDYEKLGNAGDIINVKDGFARNYLMPNNVVLPVTQGNINQMEIVKKSLIKKEAGSIADAKKLLELIGDTKITIKVKSSPEGRLYGSITNKDIAEKILEEKKIELDRKKIEIEEHIKEVGTYNVTIKLYKDVKAVIQLEIASDDVVKAEITDDGKEIAADVGKEAAADVGKETAAADEKAEAAADEKAEAVADERSAEAADEKADLKADEKDIAKANKKTVAKANKKAEIVEIAEEANEEKSDDKAVKE